MQTTVYSKELGLILAVKQPDSSASAPHQHEWEKVKDLEKVTAIVVQLFGLWSFHMPSFRRCERCHCLMYRAKIPLVFNCVCGAIAEHVCPKKGAVCLKCGFDVQDLELYPPT